MMQKNLELVKSANFSQTNASAFEALVRVLDKLGLPLEAVLILGVLETLWRTAKIDPSPRSEKAHFEVSERLSSQLGEEIFNKALAKGKLMTNEEAIEHAQKCLIN